MKMLNNTLMSKNPISRSNLYLYSSHKSGGKKCTPTPRLRGHVHAPPPTPHFRVLGHG